MTEEWRSIPSLPGYTASNEGRVCSPTRGILKGSQSERSGLWYRKVCVRGSRTLWVHSLVAEAFLGPRPAGLETRHLNGNSLDNRLTNLKYGTKSENTRDQLDHGTHWNAGKTRCPQDHLYDQANTIIRSDGRRSCRACKIERDRQYRLRRATT